MTHHRFSDFGLAEPIERALKARSHDVPTPIQAQAIPELLAGRDLLGIAQTGTGKTGAFALPILHRLATAATAARRPSAPRGLVLAPTRELAIQIGDEVRAYARHQSLRQTVIFGGVSQKKQVEALKRGVDLVIATPGRLLDLLTQRRLTLDAVEIVVLDEADRMLDMGFVRDVRKILGATPRERQSLMFSATMPAEIDRLSAEILIDPVRIEVAPQSTPVERIEQRVHHVAKAAKPGLLIDLLADPALARVIVFTRTKHGADRVAQRLDRAGIGTEAIHGNKGQGARQRALARFRSGEARVLVATDIAARGIDVANISHVVNFDLPNEPESYVHRIGRTARAGTTGVSLSLCDAEEQGHLRAIERLTGVRLTVVGDGPAVISGGRDTKRKPAGGQKRRGQGRRSSRGRNAERPARDVA